MPSDSKNMDPNNGSALVSCDWLVNELIKNQHHRHDGDDDDDEDENKENNYSLLVLDCRSAIEFSDGHIRGSVALAVPSIMLRRLAAGKVELLSTIKCQELRDRVEKLLGQSGKFILVGSGDYNNKFQDNDGNGHQAETIHVLARRLKSAGGQVATLEGGFAAFRDLHPEWCDVSENCPEGPIDTEKSEGDLMGLRSLRISTPIPPPNSSTTSSSTTKFISSPTSQKRGCDSAVVRSCGFDDDKDFPVQILPHLYLGNAANSEDSESLARHKIYYILNVTPNLPNVFENEGSIKYMQIPINDHWSQNLSSFFPQAIQFIDEARNSDKGVLVHCLAGISRSVTVTVAYLMHKCNLSLNDAFTLVRDRKSNIAPNFHFMEQLHRFETELISRGHRISANNNMEQRCIGACRPGAPCNCPQPSFLSSAVSHSMSTDLGLSPDSGIEFDRWATGINTPAE